jgi:hypothetical protein
MTNKEKFLKLVSYEDTNTQKLNDWYIANRVWLRASCRIALIILDRLDELNWSKQDLSEKSGINLEKINTIVKGRTNLDLETICIIETALNIQLLNTKLKGEDDLEENEFLIN